MRVVATAGHVDHGKSSLVLALTGTDPDRFPEEKARGLTIDLGFAFTTLPSGEVVGFVDVPGHVKFVKNMLAGVGAVEVALLVVAANEGWMPQTEEHVRILELLGVTHGLVALTKTGLVDAETLALARLELEEHLSGSPLQSWPVVPVDSPTGRGVAEVRDTLDAVLATAPAARDLRRPRLWVDRVFASRGAGTVVTGTLAGGSLAVDDEVLVEPGHRRARIRGIETHHEGAGRVAAGSRVALNLAGIDHHALHRGDAVVRPGQWATSPVVDLALSRLPGAELPRRGPLSVHVGSGEHRARLRVLDGEGLFARLHLGVGLPLAPGDRLVLRSSGRRVTVGGGEVLDVAPTPRASDAPARLALPLPRRLLATRRWLTAPEAAPLAGVDERDAEELLAELVRVGHAVRVGDEVVSRAVLTDICDRVRAAARQHHRDHPNDRGPDLAGLTSSLGLEPSRLRGALSGCDDLVVERDTVREVSHEVTAGADPVAAGLLDALDAAPFSPPAPAEVGAGPVAVRALLRDGLAVDLDGTIFSARALDEARRLLARAVTERGAITVAEARDVLGSTRKYVLPLLKRMDAEGITRRRGDERIPGPRAKGACGERGG